MKPLFGAFFISDTLASLSPSRSVIVEILMNKKSADISALKKLGDVLDSSFTFPGTNYRIGLDGIIGLIPVAGDLFTAVTGSVILFSALRYRVSGWVMLQMGFNLLLDLAAGSIPLLGDLFDFVFKSHNKNIRLIESWLEDSEQTERQSITSVTVSVVTAIALLISIIALGIYLLYTLGVFIFEAAGNIL